MKLVKIVSFGLLVVVLVCFVAATLRTLTFDVNSGLQLAHWEKTRNIASDINQHQRKELLANFREAIQIPTVSTSKTQLNITALGEFNSLLRKVFPTVFSSHLVQHEVVANYSHLFWVPGSDLALVPYMLLAHIDVVPADENDGWEAPPFSAKEMDGFIYGRGTIDNKQSVMGILQALEYLLIRGYSPQRGFFIGLGHDEEVGGLQGAMNIVKVLKKKGVQLAFVLDEGLAVLDGVISGLQGPAALIGISEKGQATVKLSVFKAPGHSSMPPRESSIGILAGAVKRVMERSPDTNAFLRTTTAVTMFNSGVKVNVLPSLAEAYVNLRIHPAQTVQEVLEFIQSTVGDERVKMELVNGFDPLPVSSYDETSFGFQTIKKTLLDQFPQVSVAPGLCIGNTDSRHYTDLAKDIYRFAPTWIKPGDTQRFHGINERISKKNYEELVVFYFNLIQNCDIKELPSPHGAGHEL
uniref:Peptidase M20 domain containing 1 n=1 Tax=Salmo trutta TaxID=8032 RepID=A0A674BR72_SALTR